MAGKIPIRTIRTQVYEILRDEICSGKHQPGSWLQEIELSERLGVSRSPVREALRQLVSDGLLVEIPNKGVFVKEFTARDIEEIFDMRVLLESYGIIRSRQNMTSASMQRLFDILSDLEDAFENKDMDLYIDTDEKLHEQLVMLGGNSLVNATYERVRSMNQQFRVLSLVSPRRFEESVAEHRQIIHAIAIGDVNTADAVNRQHLELACRSIKEQLEKR